MMKLVASTLSEQLLWRYGINEEDGFLAYDSPVPADRDYQLKSNEVYVKNGIKQPNEVRIELGLDPVGEEGDVLYFNGTELGKTPPAQMPIPDDAKTASYMRDIDKIVKGIDTGEKKAPTQLPFTINITNDSSLIEEVIEDGE
jgi:hypothetical protein